jgi:hypothetical protein
MRDGRIVVRTATPDDRELLSDLIASSYAELAQGPYDPATLAAVLPVMSRASPKLLASGTYYVAEIGGAAAGCGGWTMQAQAATTSSMASATSVISQRTPATSAKASAGLSRTFASREPARQEFGR